MQGYSAALRQLRTCQTLFGYVFVAPSEEKEITSKWQAEWSKFWMAPSRKGVATFAFCTVCNVDFSVAGGGVHEVKRHCRIVPNTSLFLTVFWHSLASLLFFGRLITL